MTAPVPIEGYTYVVLTSGPDTQPEHAQFDGVILAIPEGTDLGSGPTAPGKWRGVFGYPNGTTPTGLMRWVMSSSLPAVAKTFIQNLPDTGWLRAESEQTYRQMSRLLIERGISMSDVGTLITALHNASIANERVHASQQ